MQDKRAILCTIPELVFDIGLNNGDDAAYYLHLGYRVVGVEANPLLAAQCSQRFESEIRAGQIKVVNAGILKQPGEFVFYRSLQKDGWSTFQPDINQKPGEWEELKVSCITTQQLIADHGQPFFIKVDIEGADFQVLEALTPEIAPAYISLELNSIDPFLDRLIALGYTAFKFVDGETFRPTPPIFPIIRPVGGFSGRWEGLSLFSTLIALLKFPQPFRAKQEWNPPRRGIVRTATRLRTTVRARSGSGLAVHG